MDDLMASAKAYAELTNKEYIMTIGKKNQNRQFKLIFTNTDFKHLAGIHKLTDLDIHNSKADAVLNYALNGALTVEDLRISYHFNEIKERMENLKNLENYLDSNMPVFKWDTNKCGYSRINADYVLKENVPNDRKAYIFLKEKWDLGTVKKLKIEEIKKESAISFFLAKRDWTENQTAYTLLRNEKIDIRTNIRTVLYDFTQIKKQKESKE
jgi:hypothetical protein